MKGRGMGMPVVTPGQLLMLERKMLALPWPTDQVVVSDERMGLMDDDEVAACGSVCDILARGGWVDNGTTMCSSERTQWITSPGNVTRDDCVRVDVCLPLWFERELGSHMSLGTPAKVLALRGAMDYVPGRLSDLPRWKTRGGMRVREFLFTEAQFVLMCDVAREMGLSVEVACEVLMCVGAGVPEAYAGGSDAVVDGKSGWQFDWMRVFEAMMLFGMWYPRLMNLPQRMWWRLVQVENASDLESVLTRWDMGGAHLHTHNILELIDSWKTRHTVRRQKIARYNTETRKTRRDQRRQQAETNRNNSLRTL